MKDKTKKATFSLFTKTIKKLNEYIEERQNHSTRVSKSAVVERAINEFLKRNSDKTNV